MMPTTVFAQISRRCNLQCVMCGYEAWSRNTGFMSDEVFDRVIEQMREHGIGRLALTAAQGEPLLAPKAIPFINRAISASLDAHINTNCTPLSPRIIRELATAATTGQLTIQCSFSGYDKESYERIYVGADFEKTAAKLRELNWTFAAFDRERDITVRGVVYSQADEARTMQFIQSLGICRERISLTYPDNFAGLVNDGKSLRPGFETMTLHMCPWLTDYVVVYDDGKVSACACRDSEGVMAIGNIMTQSLAEMRGGEAYQSTVAAFNAKNIAHLPLCAKCDVPYS